MMRYAGFWPRFGAALIDFIVLAPLIALSFWTIVSASRTTALLLELPMAFAAAFYNIYFVGRWGQTIGKMVLKVRVVRLDGTEAGFRRAFYRHAVDLAFSVMISALNIYAYSSVSDHEFSLLDVDERLNLVDDKTGAWAAVVSWIYFVWGMSELVVLLLNEKRRALHDYIAGTVVIHKSETTVAV